MKQHLNLLVMLVLFLAQTAFSHAQESEPRPKKITIVADTWCPYNCDPSSDKPGIIVEIAKRAFKKHNIDVEYLIVPWERALEGVREGKFDAAIGASSGDAPDFIFPEAEQAVSVMSFYVKNDSPWAYKDIKSLEAVSLGVISGYSYGEPLDSYVSQNISDMRKIQAVSGDNSLDLNIKKLIKGRIGAFVESQNVVGYVLLTHIDKDKIKQAGAIPVTDGNKLYLAFSPKKQTSKNYAKILSDETKLMKESGEINQIISLYSKP